MPPRHLSAFALILFSYVSSEINVTGWPFESPAIPRTFSLEPGFLNCHKGNAARYQKSGQHPPPPHSLV